MLEIVVATSNPHKVEEIGTALAIEGLSSVRLLSLADCEASTPGLVLHEPEEIGMTFEENATIKALSYAQQTGRACLADDSGLEIDALRGRPGVISSHYCTDGREAGMSRAERDEKNNARVMREMEGIEESRRRARFVCVMVVAESGRALHAARGTFEGRIGLASQVPRGTHGFGYDPLFLVAADPYRFSKTSAEITPAEKSRLSHRGMATREIASFLREIQRDRATL